mmetsp:Transcript_14861/g.34914  ORF Transcript_14861/g.34914 Transcript_14861/m.34914 type:complete len:449 (+) Transcript_14861:327-1673(+)
MSPATPSPPLSASSSKSPMRRPPPTRWKPLSRSRTVLTSPARPRRPSRPWRSLCRSRRPTESPLSPPWLKPRAPSTKSSVPPSPSTLWTRRSPPLEGARARRTWGRAARAASLAAKGPPSPRASALLAAPACVATAVDAAGLGCAVTAAGTTGAKWTRVTAMSMHSDASPPRGSSTRTPLAPAAASATSPHGRPSPVPCVALASQSTPRTKRRARSLASPREAPLSPPSAPPSSPPRSVSCAAAASEATASAARPTSRSPLSARSSPSPAGVVVCGVAPHRVPAAVVAPVVVVVAHAVVLAVSANPSPAAVCENPSLAPPNPSHAASCASPRRLWRPRRCGSFPTSRRRRCPSRGPRKTTSGSTGVRTSTSGRRPRQCVTRSRWATSLVESTATGVSSTTLSASSSATSPSPAATSSSSPPSNTVGPSSKPAAAWSTVSLALSPTATQ